MSSTTHSAGQPSTPNSIGRSSNLFGKVLNKLRTPTSGDGTQGANSHENQNSTPKRSFSPMLGRRSSSKQSLRMFGSSSRAGNAQSHPLPSSSTNTSTSSLALPHNSSFEFDDDSLDLPQFESDKYAPSTTSNRASSPYSRNFPSSSSLSSVAQPPPAPSSSSDINPPNHYQPPRPSTSMSTRSRAGSASNGTGSAGSGWKSALLGRGTGASSTTSTQQQTQANGSDGISGSWSKSKNLAKSFGRSTGEATAREVKENDFANEEVTHKVPTHSSPNDLNRPSHSESSRTTQTHPTSTERTLPSSQTDPFDSGTTPGLPRNGLSRSAAPSTAAPSSIANAGASVGRKNWLASRGTAGVTGRARRVVQRVPEPLLSEPDMPLSNDAERGSTTTQQRRISPERPSPAQPSSSSRPSLSPNGHGRSRSELPPSSPKLVQSAERSAATLTLNSSSYVRKHQLDSSRPVSSLAQFNAKDSPQERDDLPSSKSAASAAASATFSQMRATQAPSNSTAFRNRFLRGESSTSLSSSSSNNSPDLPSFSSTASDPSPPLRAAPLAISTTQPHPRSNPTHGRTVSGSIKLNPMGSGLARKNSVSLLNAVDQPTDSPPPPPIDPRRMDASSRAAAQIAQARASIEESRGVEPEEIVPYASRRTSISRGQGDARYDQHKRQQQDTVTAASSTLVGSLNSSLKRSNSETLMASSLSSSSSHPPPHATTRPASSMSLYRDEPNSHPPAHMAEAALDYRQPIPTHQSQAPAFPSTSLPPMQPYRDENVYEGRSTAPSSYSHPSAPTQQPNPSHISSQPLQHQSSSFPSSQPHPQSILPNGRQVLGEVNRAYPPSSVGPAQPSTIQQGQRGYGGGKPQDFQVPLRDRSPGIAEATPSYTAQQHHYQSQQAYQHQQQQQQQHVHPSQQQQGMMYPGQIPPMSEQSHAEPIKRLPKHIMVNGKAYHRAGILGRGGSSKVYRVIAAHNNEICALKKVDTRNDAESRASFINEITLLKKLSGKPEIIQLIDAEVQSRYVYMVMEAGDTDLNSLLAGYSGLELSLNRVRYIWEQMLCAVQVIHEESIVHSDLKPANFVVVKGRVKLIDFGISKAIAADTTNIGRDQQIGTANYMPPEALLDTGLGDDGKRLMKLGRPADVWELGCILYQLVYGQQPFAHIRDLSSKILMIQNPLHRINYPPYSVPKGPRGEELTDLKTKVGPDLLQTMQSCLRYNPKQRATIPELLQQPFLRRSGDEEPSVTSIPPGSTTVNESEMAILTQRIAFMLGGQNAMDRLLKNPNENADLARKLMGELQQLKNP